MSNGKGLLFVISAPSGTGKTSLCSEALKTVDGLVRSISYTTRSPRPDEKYGVDYYFVSSQVFSGKVERGELIEWVVFGGHSYGTGREDLKRDLGRGKDLLLAIDIQGAQKLKTRFPEIISIFLLPPSLEVLEERLKGRKTDSEEEIKKRLALAEQEIKHWPHYKYIIVNVELNNAVEKLRAIVVAERSRSSRFDSYRFYAPEKVS